jgi:hypothetical protein
VDALNASIDNAFSTLGLLLVFIFVLFDLRFPQITAKIEAEIPDKKRMKERQIHRRELRKCLWQKGLPLMLVYAAVVYLMLPLLVRVVASSRLDPLHFDFLRTGFVLIFLFALGFFVWSLTLAARLIGKIREAK